LPCLAEALAKAGATSYHNTQIKKLDTMAGCDKINYIVPPERDPAKREKFTITKPLIHVPGKKLGVGMMSPR